MEISWRLIIIVILVLFFLYLLYNAMKITVVLRRANKNLKKRRKMSDSMADLQDGLADLTRELKEGPK